MSFLNPIEDLVNYIISHIHKGLLINKFDPQQLSTNIVDGTYTLQDIEFNCKSINSTLLNSPLHVNFAKASRMNFFFPNLLKIFEKPVKIRFTDLEISLCSAKNSGFFVSLPNIDHFGDAEDKEGLNLLTKAIGKLLSNINVEIFLLTINIHDSENCLKITIPKFSYTESSNTKKFKIEGV